MGRAAEGSAGRRARGRLRGRKEGLHVRKESPEAKGRGSGCPGGQCG